MKTALSWTWPLKTLPPLLLLAVLASGDVLFPGRCSQRQAVEGIQFPSFLGKWYVFAEYLGSEYTIQCHTIEFSSPQFSKDSGFSRRKFGIIDIAQVLNVSFLQNFQPGRAAYRSRAQFLPNTTAGTYNATPYINRDNEPPISYDILHIEYNRTAFIWGCIEGLDKGTDETINSEYLVVLTRVSTPEEEQIASIYQTAADLGLDAYLWTEISHTNCHYSRRS